MTPVPAAVVMRVTTWGALEGCFRCGRWCWEVRLHADGAPYLRCARCGRETPMPGELQLRLPLQRLPRDIEARA